MPTKPEKVKRQAHAISADRHHKKKLETHQRVQVWVPRDKVDAFKASFQRMQKKWK